MWLKSLVHPTNKFGPLPFLQDCWWIWKLIKNVKYDCAAERCWTLAETFYARCVAKLRWFQSRGVLALKHSTGAGGGSMRAQCSCGLVWLVVAGREGRGSQQAAPTAWQSSKQGRGAAACCLLACTTPNSWRTKPSRRPARLPLLLSLLPFEYPFVTCGRLRLKIETGRNQFFSTSREYLMAVQQLFRQTVQRWQNKRLKKGNQISGTSW